MRSRAGEPVRATHPGNWSGRCPRLTLIAVATFTGSFWAGAAVIASRLFGVTLSASVIGGIGLATAVVAAIVAAPLLMAADGGDDADDPGPTKTDP